MQEIQAFGQQERESQNMLEKASAFCDNMLKALNLSAIFHPSVEFLTSLGTVIVVGFGGYLAYENRLSVPDIVAFLLYLSLFYAPITGLAQLLENAQQAMVSVERVCEVLDAPSDIKDAPGAAVLSTSQGEITFSGVNFYYESTSPVLKNITFSAKPGQMVALVGPTGVGKTTLTQLICRFLRPRVGENHARRT